MLLAPQQVYQFAVANPDVMKHFPRYCDCDALGTPPTIHKRSVSSAHRKPSVWPSGDHVTIDLAAPLVQVLVAKDNSGDTRYLYGVTRIGEQQSAGWLYHLTDALGSVRQLVDSSGNVQLARGYTPYGEPLWLNGMASSRYVFTGEDYDPTVGLVFLRARYMQPTLGIFLARDPWGGDVMRSGSMNGWGYVSANPINRIDPGGKTDLDAVLAMLGDNLLSNPCIELIPFGPPLGKNVFFINLNFGIWTPTKEWVQSQRDLVEKAFTRAMNRYSGKNSDGNGPNSPYNNPAFGSLPVALTQLKVSESKPMFLFRKTVSGGNGNAAAQMVIWKPSMTRYFEVLDLFFAGNTSSEPNSGREGELAHEIAHYWDFDGRLSNAMYNAYQSKELNFYMPPTGNSVIQGTREEYFVDGVKLYLYDKLDEGLTWSDDIGIGLQEARKQGRGRDGLFVNNGQISYPTQHCNKYGDCEIIPPTGERMRDIYDFVEDQFNLIQPQHVH